MLQPTVDVIDDLRLKPEAALISRPGSISAPGERALAIFDTRSVAEFSRFQYCRCMRSTRVPGGVVHKLPGDLRETLITSPTALEAWMDITPLARNEFICWVEDAKQKTTRERRIRRTRQELEEGQRRPCCWPGCAHRERNGT